MKRLLSILSHTATALMVLGVCSLALAAPATQVIITGKSGGGATVTGGKLDVNSTFAPSGTQAVSIASGAVASGAYASGSIASGAMVDLGAKADAVCGTATGTCSLIALQKFLNNSLGGTGTTGAAVPATAAYMGINVGGNLTGVASGNGGAATGARVTIADIGTGEYETVAASQTSQVLGATGAAGDYLLQVVCTPGTTSPGVVTVLDNATALVSFPGGASSVSNLLPFTIPVNAYSTSGAWKLTTGANVTCVGVGNFT